MRPALYMTTANLDSRTKTGFYALIGLFQSSGAFITSEERSLAFWLSEHGFVPFILAEYKLYLFSPVGDTKFS